MNSTNLENTRLLLDEFSPVIYTFSQLLADSDIAIENVSSIDFFNLENSEVNIDVDYVAQTITVGRTFFTNQPNAFNYTVTLNNGNTSTFDVSLLSVNEDFDIGFSIISGFDNTVISAVEDSEFTFQMPNIFFSEGTVRSIDVTLTNGDPLPNWLSFDPNTKTFSGTPTNDDVGALSVRVSGIGDKFGNDNNAPRDELVDSFVINVTNTNDLPIAQGEAATIAQNKAVVFTEEELLANDNDIDAGENKTLRISSIGNAVNGSIHHNAVERTIVFTPQAGYTGPASFDYQVSDNNFKESNTATVTIDVTADGSNEPIINIDFGEAGQTVAGWNEVTESTSGPIALLDASGNASGVSLEVVDDFSASDTRGHIFTGVPTEVSQDYLVGSNNNPSAQLRLSGLTPGVAHKLSIISSRDFDSGNRETAFEITGASTYTETVDSIDAVNNRFAIEVTPDASGVISISANAGQNNTSSIDFFYLNALTIEQLSANPSTITGTTIREFVFDAPLADRNTHLSIVDRQVTVYTFTQLLEGSNIALSDVQSIDFFNLERSPVPLTVDHVAQTITAGEGYSSTQRNAFSYTVTLNSGETSTSSVSFSARHNEPNFFVIDPGFDNTLISATEDSEFAFEMPDIFSHVSVSLINATLANGDPLPEWLSFDAATRVFSGTPSNADVGALSIRVAGIGNRSDFGDSPRDELADGFVIKVNNINDAPIAQGEAATIAQNKAVVFTEEELLINDNDVDAGENKTLRVISVTNALNGSVNHNTAARTITFTPQPGYTGPASFDYQVADNNASASNTVTVAIDIAPGDTQIIGPSDDDENSVINIDFGEAGQTAQGWNEVTENTRGPIDLLDANGNASGVSLEVVDDFSTSDTRGHTFTDVPEEVSTDYLVGSNNNPSAQLRLDGLTPGVVHRLSIVSSRDSDGGNRQTIFQIIGALYYEESVNSVDAENNRFTIELIPDESGVISINAFSGNDNVSALDFFYLNALTIEETTATEFTVTGTDGDDEIFGRTDAERIIGHDEIFDGGPGNDSIFSEGGSDTIKFGIGDGNDNVNTVDRDIDPTNQLNFSPLKVLFKSGLNPEDIAISHFSDTVIFTIKQTGDSLFINNYFRGTTRIESIEFEDGGSIAVESLTTLEGTEGNDRLIGAFNTSSEDFYQLPFPVALLGNGGDDVLVGPSSATTFDGGAGNDMLSAAEGSLILFGRGDGLDTVEVLDIIDILELNPNLELRFKSGLSASDIEYFIDGDKLTFRIIGTEDQISFLNYEDILTIENNEIIASKTNITFEDGGSLNILGPLEANPETDVINGTDGNDVLNGTAANELINGLAGNDRINANAGDDTLVGGGGRDQLYGNDGNDQLFGGDGWDGLYGGRGDDTLHAGDGGFLRGDAGNDTYIFEGNFGGNSINNNDANIASIDTVRFETASIDDLWFSRNGEHLRIVEAGTNNRVDIRGWYTDNNQRVERIEAGGLVLFSDQVDRLVIAMVSYDSPAGIGNDIAPAVREFLQPLLTNTWLNIDTPVNNAPVAENDFIEFIDGVPLVTAVTTEATSIVFSAAELLANDTDIDGDNLSIVSASGSPDGTATYDSVEQTVTFTPRDNFLGFAFFQYTITDGNGGTDTASATVNVQSTGMRMVNGTDGDDVLRGVVISGTDTGADEIFDGGPGNDRIFSQGGSDTVRFGVGDGNDRIHVHNPPYDGYDAYGTQNFQPIAILFKSGLSPDDITVSHSGGSIAFTINQTGESLFVDNYFGHFRPAGIASIEFEDGGSIAVDGLGILEGTEGDDTLESGFNTESTTFYHVGESGVDTFLFGKEGDDTLLSLSPSAILDGGPGNDRLVTAEGSRVLFGRGDGVDSVEVTDNSDNAKLDIYLRFKSGLSEDDIESFVEDGNHTFRIIGTEDQISFISGNGDPLVIKLSFEDAILDVVNGSNDDDTINGTAENELINGFAGNDRINANAGDDTVRGSTGRDQLYGNDGNDQLFGGDGWDGLYGGRGDDTLNAGDGGYLRGDAGNDTYVFEGNIGNNSINNNDSDIKSTDTVSFVSASVDDLWFSRRGDHLRIIEAGTDNRVDIRDWYTNDAQQVDRIEAEGSVLLNTQVDQLVNAMASFDAPVGSGSVVPQDIKEALQPALTDAWQIA